MLKISSDTDFKQPANEPNAFAGIIVKRNITV